MRLTPIVGAANVYFFHEGFDCWSPDGTPRERHRHMPVHILPSTEISLTARAETVPCYLSMSSYEPHAGADKQCPPGDGSLGPCERMGSPGRKGFHHLRRHFPPGIFFALPLWRFHLYGRRLFRRWNTIISPGIFCFHPVV